MNKGIILVKHAMLLYLTFGKNLNMNLHSCIYNLIGVRSSGHRVSLGIKRNDDCIRIRLGMEARLRGKMAFQVPAAIIFQGYATLDELATLLFRQVHSGCFAVPRLKRGL